jgi:regulator of sigma E protease
MARRIGVRVLTFSLGFGPKILSFRRGETEYCVSAIPLGGYVKMAGENPDDARTGANDEFLSKTKWQRFQVLIMGPVMNLVLAVVVMTFVLYQGADVPDFNNQPVVVGSLEDDSPARSAGILPGDRIVALDGVATTDWDRFSLDILPKGGRKVTLTIDRGGQRLEKEVAVSAVGKYEAGYLGVMPPMRPEIAVVTAGEPADQAGLRAGDVLLAVGGKRPVTREEAIDLIRVNEGKPVVFEVERNGKPMTITVTPRKTANLVRIGATISRTEFKTIKPTFVEAAQLSVKQNWDWAAMIVRTLAGLFTRDTPIKQLMGPVAIFSLSGEAAEAGWIQLFSLMAMISLNLGLLNLMPVPVLDGGHIAILALEGLSRRDFSMKVKEKMLLAGFALLLMLMVTVIYNDLARIQWFQKLMIWR